MPETPYRATIRRDTSGVAVWPECCVDRASVRAARGEAVIVLRVDAAHRFLSSEGERTADVQVALTVWPDEIAEAVDPGDQMPELAAWLVPLDVLRAVVPGTIAAP